MTYLRFFLFRGYVAMRRKRLQKAGEANPSGFLAVM